MEFVNITENRFRDFMNKIPNASESYKNGKKTVNYEFYRITDNNFSLSYHLKFTQKNIQFNFWFDKISYLNSKEIIAISFFDGNKPNDKFSLKNILTTSDFNVFKAKIESLVLQYK
jgi:hypothetical protein